MKIIATADLHFGLDKEGDKSARKLAEKINSSDADVLIIAGDTAAFNESLFLGCLGLFDGFEGHKLITAGNHDLWTTGGDSYEIYKKELPKLARECGFHYLDDGPFVYLGIGFVGSSGWYDYSFGDESLGIPGEYYEEKILPGVMEWNDRNFIKWRYSDREFTSMVLESLKKHLELVNDRVEKIVSTIHHIPFENMVTKKDDIGWTFGNAFMGSRKIGELLLKYAKVKYLFCAHSHIGGRFRNGHIECINIGSTYEEKKYVEIEV